MSEKQALVPQLRFPEFRNLEGWKISRLGDGFERLTAKNAENNKNVLTISAQLGLVSQLEYFNKGVAAKDLTGYYILHKGDFAYNKSYSKGYPMGAIKPLRLYEKGVVSTLYICFRARKDFNDLFFEHYFELGLLNSEIAKIAQEGGRAHGLLNVGVNDFFEKTKICYPQQEEQQKIADCLSSLDELIAAQVEKIDALKTYKKGLMQQLFPREGETVPRLRFPEFQDAGGWESTTLGLHCKITTGKLDANAMVENGKYRFYTCAKNYYFIDKYAFDTDALLVSGNGANVGYIHHYNGKFNAYQRTYVLDQFEHNIFYVKYFLETNLSKRILLEKKDGNTPYIVMTTLSEMVVLIPTDDEQQKIADFLLSLDALIIAQADRLDALKAHKKGLMQQLFPSLKAITELGV